MTNQNNVAQPVLTDDELKSSSPYLWLAAVRTAEVAERMLRHFEQIILSKLRAPVADERAAFEAARQKRDPDAPLGRMCLVNNDEYTNGEDQAAWEGWQDRAALASAPVASEPPGEVVVTYDGDRIVAVTRQDDEGRILSVIAEARMTSEEKK